MAKGVSAFLPYLCYYVRRPEEEEIFVRMAAARVIEYHAQVAQHQQRKFTSIATMVQDAPSLEREEEIVGTIQEVPADERIYKQKEKIAQIENKIELLEVALQEMQQKVQKRLDDVRAICDQAIHKVPHAYAFVIRQEQLCKKEINASSDSSIMELQKEINTAYQGLQQEQETLVRMNHVVPTV